MFKPSSLALLGLAFSVCAHAGSGLDSLDIEALLDMDVEGASRYTQPLADAPATATVIRAEDMARQGLSTWGEALGMVRGVYTTNDRAYTYLGVRGFGRPGDYNSRILMLVDGARFNDALYDQAMLGHEAPIDLSWVKRLEFVPGPASALYGGNALFGITNALLWSGADLNGTRLTMEGGSAGTAGIKWLSGRQLDNGADWVVGAATGSSRGETFRLDAPTGPAGLQQARHLDDERHAKFFGKFSHHGWRLLVTYAQRYKEIPTGYWDTTFNATGTDTRDQSLHVDLTHASNLSKDWHQLARLHYGHYRYDGNYNYTPAPLNRDEDAARWWQAEYHLGYRGLSNHHLRLGVEARQSQKILQRNFNVDPYLSILDDQRRENSYAVSLQDEWRLSPTWLANVGLRSDHAANHTITSPRLALIHQPVAGASIKLLYGKAFRPANAYERYYQDGGFLQKANPGLRPERIETREIAADYALTPALRLGVSHYRYTLHDLIEQVTDPADGLLVFVNQSESRARGWEFELETLLGDWRLRGSVAWQRVSLAGQDASNSPELLGKLFLDGPIAAGWQLGANLQSTSRRRTLDGEVDSHVVGNLTLRQARSGPFGRWSLILKNAGNVIYRDPVAFEQRQSSLRQPGRHWLVRWELPL